MPQIVQQILGEGWAWDHFRAFENEFPSKFQHYAAILITGSHYSISEGLEWIENLKSWLRTVAEIADGPKVIGICFGAQALAVALGGHVGVNPSGKFALGIEHIIPMPCLLRSPVIVQSEMGGGFDMIVSHGEQVLELPPGAIHLGTSKTAMYEVWAVRDNVLALQPHPELTPDLVLQKIHPAIVSSGRLDAEEAADVANTLLTRPIDSGVVWKMLQLFVRHGLFGKSGLRSLLDDIDLSVSAELHASLSPELDALCSVNRKTTKVLTEVALQAQEMKVVAAAITSQQRILSSSLDGSLKRLEDMASCLEASLSSLEQQ